MMKCPCTGCSDMLMKVACAMSNADLTAEQCGKVYCEFYCPACRHSHTVRAIAKETS